MLLASDPKFENCIAVAGGSFTIATRGPHYFPSRDACFAAKVRAQGRAAFGRCLLFGDHPGQCLVSDDFEARIGRAEKA
jgi:hypothetical protein